VAPFSSAGECTQADEE